MPPNWFETDFQLIMRIESWIDLSPAWPICLFGIGIWSVSNIRWLTFAESRFSQFSPLGLFHQQILFTQNCTYFPTKFSKTELFPALWPPTTAICGKSICIWKPDWVNASCNLLTMGINASIPIFPAIFAVYLLSHRFSCSKFHYSNREKTNTKHCNPLGEMAKQANAKKINQNCSTKFSAEIFFFIFYFFSVSWFSFWLFLFVFQIVALVLPNLRQFFDTCLSTHNNTLTNRFELMFDVRWTQQQQKILLNWWMRLQVVNNHTILPIFPLGIGGRRMRSTRWSQIVTELNGCAIDVDEASFRWEIETMRGNSLESFDGRVFGRNWNQLSHFP